MKSLLVVLLLTSCQEKIQDSVSKERAWDWKNNPTKMGIDYIVGKYKYSHKFAQLPTSGDLETRPWSGDYWPTYKGGITYRWNSSSSRVKDRIGYKLLSKEEYLTVDTKSLSPAEKYDLYIGNFENTLTKFERNRTKILQTIKGNPQYDEKFEIPRWEGLCHAWAPATIHYKSPKPVTLVGPSGIEVSFGASDIKALLTYFVHHYDSLHTYFLGGRCNVDFGKLRTKLNTKKITKEEFDKEMQRNECLDTNAGAFHIVLTNQIALMKEGFIVDVTRDFEVWNQAVHGFETKVLSEKMGKSENAAPGTVKEVTVRTKMYYTVEVDHSWEQTVPTSRSERVAYYEYRLELNKNGEIIGGEWLSEDRPDFLWNSVIPEFKGYFKELKRVYEESIN